MFLFPRVFYLMSLQMVLFRIDPHILFQTNPWTREGVDRGRLRTLVMISGHSRRGRHDQSESAGLVHVVQEGLRKEILQSAG